MFQAQKTSSREKKFFFTIMASVDCANNKQTYINLFFLLISLWDLLIFLVQTTPSDSFERPTNLVKHTH